jgi:hypothetical protein
MAVQGQALSQQAVERIVSLLRETEMTMPEIATRMQCSRSAVISINRRFQIREYLGLRGRWQNSTSNRTWNGTSQVAREKSNGVFAAREQENFSTCETKE